MKRNYDAIARFYDPLARLFFGTALINAQLFLLQDIPAGAHLLIIGGGTGWVLDQITMLHPSGLTITYVDASKKMVELSHKRNTGNNRVTFIAAPLEAAVLGTQYDVVLTPFFLDNFQEGNAKKIMALIDKHLSQSGKWLYSDFQNTGVVWQKAILKVMYLFFRISCGIEASRLPNVAAIFEKMGYKVTSRKLFLDGFVAAEVYGRA